MFFSDDVYIGTGNQHPENDEVFGSHKDFYQSQSHGLLQLDGEIINEDDDANGRFDWLNMGNSSSYPTSTNSDWHYSQNDLPEDAIAAASARGWDVDYRVIFIIAAGSDQYLSMGTAHYNINDADDHLGVCVFGERSNLEWYRDIPETPTATHMAFSHIGTWAHEMGHLFGNGLTTGTGVHAIDPGDYSTMSCGYRTGPNRKGECPCDHDPYERILLGWATPTVITSNFLNESIQYIEEDADESKHLIFINLLRQALK